MGVEEPTQEENYCLEVSNGCNTSDSFQFGDGEFFKRFFDVAPSRPVLLEWMRLSAAQLNVLATRPHPIRLTFDACELEDGGTAFVDALENRQSSFSSSTFKGPVLFSEDNMKRLFQQVNTIDHLRLLELDDDTLALSPVGSTGLTRL